MMKHGFAPRGRRHPLYARWINIRQRCRNPRHPRYPDYGGRGITVAECWDDFATFLRDVGEPPGGNYDDWSLDRIDNDGPYAPGNVRWADLYTQRGNRRDSAQSRRIQYRTPWPFGVLAEEKDGYAEEADAAVRYLLGLYDRGEALTDEELEQIEPLLAS